MATKGFSHLATSRRNCSSFLVPESGKEYLFSIEAKVILKGVLGYNGIILTINQIPPIINIILNRRLLKSIVNSFYDPYRLLAALTVQRKSLGAISRVKNLD